MAMKGWRVGADEGAAKVGGTGAAQGARRMRSDPMAEARRRVTDAVPAIAEALVTGAKQGSMVHLKLLVELGGLEKGLLAPRAKKRKGKTLEQVLMAEWRKETGAQAGGAG